MDHRPPETVGAPRRRVLIVEDDDDLRDALVDLLGGRGFEVRSAGDGVQGLEQLRSWRPDLVVADLGLPLLDGSGLRAAQLETPELAGIPLIVVSGSARQHEEAERLRPAAIVPKPFRAETLVSVVVSCLRS
jgi:CheY-like chemotaxis protein